MATPSAVPVGAGLLRPFQRFFALESASGLLLLAATVVALVWANSPLASAYAALWGAPITVDLGVLTLSKPLLLWVNDGLMAVFFFVVGLEIKREVLVGELADRRKAALSVAAAAGGMAVPAAIYASLNLGGEGASGWAIPMATDIAFALGVLALLGPAVPLALKVFVTAVAIVDDLGAVVVIALFYTEKLSIPALVVAHALLAVSIAFNRLGVRRTWPYAVVGVALWVALLKSGVHATIAGVLLAFTIPSRRVIDAPEFVRRAETLLARFRAELRPGRSEPTADQQHVLHELEAEAGRLETPLKNLEHALHPWVAFLVIPVFALANAGVALGGDAGAALGGRILPGVALGLFIGKPVGILAASWLAQRAGLAALPAGVSWLQVVGASMLCGIGFTMSLFIGGLAFPEEGLLHQAKLGILAGSALSVVAGTLVLRRAGRRAAAAR